MKRENKFIQNYLDAYKAMRDRAIEIIKNYGKTLEIEQILKDRLMKEKGWKKWPKSWSDEYYSVMEEIEEWKYNEMYWCSFEGKFDQVYCGYITKVRWNDEREEIEVYLDSDDESVSEWLPDSYIGYEKESIYQTILEFLD